MPRLFPKLILLSFLALAACESDEDRAARFYQSGLALLEEGQVDQALVEFRNVLAADPNHVAARLAYADAQRVRGNVADANSQYLRLIEQNPEDVAALIALSEIATLGANWEAAETYGRAAAALRPADPAVIAVIAMLDYRAAVLAKEDAARATASDMAREVLQQNPGNVIARKIVIDNDILDGDIPDALAAVSAGLAIDPAQLELHIIRVGLLSGSGDTARAQAALEDMAAQFPDNPDVRQNLIAWYMDQDDLPAAEGYLRRLAARPDAGSDQRITVVDFLRQTQGPDAALAELDQMIADDADNRRYRALRASIYFAQDRQDAAIADMRDVIATDKASDATRDYKVMLAQMLQAQGDDVGARALVTQVLTEDAGHVEALKMSAQWSIADDDPNAAVITLRQALAQAPRDISLITLLGTAHERAGDHDLAGERYALIVEISGQAAGPSLRYAGFLLDRNRIDAAETVVANALTVAPQDIELLAAMAEIQMRQSAWNSVTRIIWKLRALDMPVANGIADGIQVELLKRQDRYAETVALLQGMIADGATSMAAKAQLVEAQVRAGHLDDARTFVRDQLAEQPDDPTLRFLQAGILVLMDDLPAAKAVYRALLNEFPDNEQVFGSFYAILALQGREDAAAALLNQILTAAPGAFTPNMIKAGQLESQGDFDGAIAIYEALYAQDSDNPVVANNLASMITARRDNADDLARAAAIAARLRGSDVPQFQDTLGWIAYRRGNYPEALSYLESAARELPDDALTHFHLGMTFAALGRTMDARAALTQALKLGEDTGLAQVDAARDALAKLPQ
jgi:tetratricopeptide (TPR) repeat protein